MPVLRVALGSYGRFVLAVRVTVALAVVAVELLLGPWGRAVVLTVAVWLCADDFARRIGLWRRRRSIAR